MRLRVGALHRAGVVRGDPPARRDMAREGREVRRGADLANGRIRELLV